MSTYLPINNSVIPKHGTAFEAQRYYHGPLIDNPVLLVSRLAYAEMKLILARLIFNFDLALAEESTEWMKNQKAYNMWSKPPLFLYLTPRQVHMQ